jgi:excisionase family DNA binding protein
MRTQLRKVSNQLPGLISTSQAGALIGCGRRNVVLMIERRELPERAYFRLGKNWKIRAAVLQDWLAGRIERKGRGRSGR